MIIVEKEPEEVTNQHRVSEKCYFCNLPTTFWNVETNTPVCVSCSIHHDVKEIHVNSNPFNP